MKLLFIYAALSAAVAVVLGAFAAHGLKGKLSVPMIEVFQTGVHYQLYHSVAILVLVLFYRMWPNAWLLWGAGAIALGILFFSGSLYVLALTQVKWVGPITPLGGLLFIIGWLCVVYAAVQYDK